jgi:hypothetical protein
MEWNKIRGKCLRICKFVNGRVLRFLRNELPKFFLTSMPVGEVSVYFFYFCARHCYKLKSIIPGYRYLVQ